MNAAVQTKKIAKIEVIAAGSNPDVDSDFNTKVRGKAIEHVTSVYGEENISSIITFTVLGAKNAFKTMCTIYQVPFVTANKISSLVPPAIEGVAATIDDLFNPDSERYSEGAEFREAVAGDEWKKVVSGMKAVEGRVKSTGLHPCGLIISGKPLQDTLPMQTTKEGVISTQWTYPECEDMGLIKFDFLGLDTVDIIQQTIQNIIDNGKTPPNMVDLIHGKMDDKKVYEMFSLGNTIGIFQFGSPLVREYIKLLKPTEFEDLVVTTASCRPGPMGMNSHTNYATRKNSSSKNKVVPIHEDFWDSPLEEILEKTENLIVFQEQILKIANEIAGMTMQEGDKLRKAMGKKQKHIMDSMKIKFTNGATSRGYSLEAIDLLWDTIAKFASYGFNRAHAVAYAMVSYQSAYLKVYYPIEFMSALINQQSEDKDKKREYLKEARRMGIKVGTVDINASQAIVAPDFNNKTPHDILFGIGSINSVSETMAEIIVEERNKNGEFNSIQDLIARCEPLGVSNKTIFENLAYSGAFDNFGVSRKAVADTVPTLIKSSKTKTQRGDSLFDLFDNNTTEAPLLEVNLDEGEYPFVEKLQREANTVGLYLTGHPLDNIGAGLSFGSIARIADLKKSTKRTQQKIVGCVTDLDRKTSKTGAISITLTADDGKDYLTARVSKKITLGISKRAAQQKIEQAYINRTGNITPELIKTASNDNVQSQDDIQENNVYIMDVAYAPAYNDYPERAEIVSIRQLHLADDGKLPIRVRVIADSDKIEEIEHKFSTFLNKVEKKYPGEYPIHAAFVSPNELKKLDENIYYKKLARQILKDREELEKQHSETVAAEESSSGKRRKTKKAAVASNKRTLPPLIQAFSSDIIDDAQQYTEEELSEALEYKQFNNRIAKNVAVEEILSKNFGAERIDFGIYNDSMKE